MNPELCDPIFGVRVFVNVGGSEEEICQQWKKLTSDPLTPDGSLSFVVQGKDGTVLVWLSEDPADEILVHEAVHIAMCTMRSRRIPIKASNEEIIAYLTTYWYTQLKEVTSGT